MEVFIVTDVEGGWDNVNGAFKKYRSALVSCLDEDENYDNLSEKELEKLVADTQYVVHTKILE